MYKKFETEFGGKKLVVETGKMAGLANGSCLVRLGETAVLVNVTMAKEAKEGITAELADLHEVAAWIRKENKK